MSQHTNEHEPGKRIGRGMITLAWLAILVILTILFGDWERKQFNPNPSPEGSVDKNGTATVTLKRNRYNHYVTNGKINGENVTFFLDTGATVVSIPAHIAKRLHLEKGPKYPVQTANGTTSVYGTVIHRLQIGPIRLNNVQASINPSMDGDEILLGMSVLKQVEFLQQGNTLTLKQYH